MVRLVAFAVVFATVVCAAATWGETGSPVSEFERRKLALEEQKLVFDKEKYQKDRALEWWKTFGTALPLGAAALAFMFQIWAQRRNEMLQYELKVAEIVMDAWDTNQVRSKAGLMAALFPGRASKINTRITSQTAPYSRSLEIRKELLNLLAENPGSREEIIRAWQIMYPWDSEVWASMTEEQRSKYKWFVELKRDGQINKNAQIAPGARDQAVSSSSGV